MGISGLLQFIKDASEPISVKKYSGQTVAVDTYCWLHKGAFSCAEKLAKGEPTDQYVTYCLKFVDMLLSFGVKPILVFDGQNLPSKEEVEKARRDRRQANLQRGKQLLREGKVSEARDCFTRCINVTSSMAHDVIKAARARGVDCLVAPYEADAQLAFLNKANIAQAIITEDSDLLAFGCKKVILKMDKLGNGLEIDQKHLGRCRSLGNVFTEEKFRYMCILSGCDYLPSLHGIGLGKACKLLKVANNPDILKVIRKMGQYLKMNVTVPEEYLEGFTRANNTFLYQLVFDPLSRKLMPLNPYPDHIDPATLGYAGHHVGDKKALQVALGNVDIHSMEVIDDYNPDTAQPPKPRSRGWGDGNGKASPLGKSIWSKSYTPGVPLSSPPPSIRSTEKSPSGRREKVVSISVLKEMQVKRPRQESGISEKDMLLQYSTPSPKKQRRVGGLPQAQAQPATPGTQPRVRNRFATLLQRRNQEDGLSDEAGTRSRFFCNRNKEATCPKQGTAPEEVPSEKIVPEDGMSSSRTPQEDEDVELRAKDEEHASDLSASSFSPSSYCSRGVFDWSSSRENQNKPRTEQRPSHLSLLQQFQHKKETVAWNARLQRSSTPTPLPQLEGEEDSSPSQDSAYFSQPSQCTFEREQNPTQDVSSSQGSISTDAEDMSLTVTRAKVSGLPRVGSLDTSKRVKIKPSAPARASGLRKKPNIERSSTNNENRPGLQATISSLWKSFSFRKDNPKCKTGEPMSPVKDNVSTLTPETDKDIYFISVSKSAQKTICF